MSSTHVLRDGRRLCIDRPLPGDAPALLEFLDKVGGESDFLLFGKGQFGFSVEQEVAFIKACDEQGNLLLKGEVDDRLVATLSLERGQRPRARHVAELGVTVLEAFWGLGIGRLMMEAGIEWARRAGLAKINLRVRSDHAVAIRLYERLGFIAEGRERWGMLLGDTFHDLVHMGLQLG